MGFVFFQQCEEGLFQVVFVGLFQNCGNGVECDEFVLVENCYLVVDFFGFVYYVGGIQCELFWSVGLCYEVEQCVLGEDVEFICCFIQYQYGGVLNYGVGDDDFLFYVGGIFVGLCVQCVFEFQLVVEFGNVGFGLCVVYVVECGE